MIRAKTSPIWFLKHADLQRLLDESASICEVLRAFNLDPYSGNHRTLQKRIKEDNFDLTKLNENRKCFYTEKLKKLRESTLKPLDEIFCENSTYSSHSLKKRILKEELLKEICVNCGLEKVWNGLPLNLQLDHINGISDDNRINNLRFLCPNCHSQTPTFAGRRLKKVKHYETAKQKELRLLKSRKVKIRPSLETLLIKVKAKGYVKTGKQFGVSDNTIRNWIKDYNADDSLKVES